MTVSERRPLRVGIVTHVVSRTDGQGRVNLEVAGRLAERGHRITFIASHVDPAVAKLPNVSWQPVEIPHWLPSAPLRHAVFAVRSRRLLRRLRVALDVIHLNGAITFYPGDVNTSHFVHAAFRDVQRHWRPVRLGWRAAYQPVVSTIDAVCERRAYAVASRVVAVSNDVRTQLMRDVGVPPGRIAVIRPGVDLAEFRPMRTDDASVLRPELGLDSQQFLLLFAGDAKTPRKNLDLVLHALAELDSHLHVVVVGAYDGGPYPAMAAELGLRGRVHFLGLRSDLPQLMREANALACPSHYEPWGLVVPEAMACGLPVIVTPTVAASELVGSDETGFLLASANDVAGLVAVLRRLVEDPHLAQQVGAAGRRVVESLSWDSVAQQYEALYYAVTASPVRSTAVAFNG